MMIDNVNYYRDGEIGLIRVRSSSLNIFSDSICHGLLTSLKQFSDDDTRAVVIFFEGPASPIDYAKLDRPSSRSRLGEVLSYLDAYSKLTVASLHGNILGNALETALCCHYRCSLPGAAFALPEIKIGLLPGHGGTQRLPRLTGVGVALDLMLSGSSLTAHAATAAGLIDAVLESDDMLHGAQAYARKLLDNGASIRAINRQPLQFSDADRDMLAATQKDIARKRRGERAPGRIVECLEFAANLPLEEGVRRERQLFLASLDDPQSTALRHVLLAEREAGKVRGLSPTTENIAVSRVGVIGAGTMGSGIAMCFAGAGLPVELIDTTEEGLQRGLGIVRKNYARSVQRGRLSREDADAALSLISGHTDYGALADVDLVIEAAFEDLQLKQEIFRQLDTICKPDAILATNTSYQDINAIAGVTTQPSRVLGMHFFSPANVMKLLEVVRAEKTSDQVVASAMTLAEKIGKIPVLAGVCYGFIGNRMYRAYQREAQLCLLEGATPVQVDSAMEQWGMAMGPLAVGDLAGLDIGYKARQSLSIEEKGDPGSYRVPDLLVEQGRLGQKAGRGYYQYASDTRVRSEDPEVLKLVESAAKAQGLERRVISDDEIVSRLTLALINEGAHILEEGIAQRASDLDVVYVYGYGFPRYRGGPMHLADCVGLRNVYERVCDYRQRLSERNWRPSRLLQELAAKEGAFSASEGG